MSSVQACPQERAATSHRPHRPSLLANAAIAVLWLWLYWPLAGYLSIIFSREDFRTNQIILLIALLLIAARVRQAGFQLRPDARPQWAPLPLTLALGGSLLYLAAERFLNVNTLSAALFGLASYGLLGLWLAPPRWRQGLPALLLLIGALPFGDHLQTFIGYPMRLLTASVIRDGLAAAGVAAVGIDTILVFENGVSQVDLPCSGIKSLWTGGLFLIAATWIERRPLNGRWLVTAVIFALLLFLANLTRVTVLVVVGEVLTWRLAATMLHVPLGVLGFVAVCGAAVWLLRRQQPFAPPNAPATPVSDDTSARPAWLAPLLMTAVALMALAYTARPQSTLSQPPVWHFSSELITKPMPLKPNELNWLTRDGAESADRYQFQWGHLSGSMLFITSRTWRAHHRPERCFEVYGLSLDDSRTHLVTADVPVRFVLFGDGARRSLYSATYWFQSSSQITDDYGTRMWADLAPQRDHWVLVSILFDGVVDPAAPDVEAFYLALQESVGHALQNR